MGGTEPGGGTGGVPSGGTGQGGSGGEPKGGTGGNDCEAAVSNAQAALMAAQACSAPASSCSGTVEDLCGCTVPVNDQDSPATKSYLELREAAIACGVPCLLIPCAEPTKAMCSVGAATADRIVAVASCVWAPR
jgi:hypothetical protein